MNTLIPASMFGLLHRNSFGQRRFQLVSAWLLQLAGLYLYICVDPFMVTTTGNRGFQLFASITINKFLNLTLTTGLDGVAAIFILLTITIFSLCFHVLGTAVMLQTPFFLTLSSLECVLILVFSTLDIFAFYIFFEGSLLPMFYVVGFWGSRTRRIKAAFYLFLYTMATALLTLSGIFYMTTQVGSTFYPDLINYTFTGNEQKVLWLCLFVTFATKIPMMPFHIWLPEAHVEAPTIGSVILASIPLKLGGFGFIRYMIPLLPLANNFFLPLIYATSICSILYASMITLRQLDLKRIIAYSSIAHMNMVVLGIFANNNCGLDGALYLMVGHGVISSALFLAVGVLYDRYHSRLVRYYGGLITVMPLAGIFLTLSILGNIGFPGTSNFIGEFLILTGVYLHNPFVAFSLGSGIILSAVYSFWLFNRVYFGVIQIKFNLLLTDLNRTELSVFTLLAIYMITLGINGDFIFDACLVTNEQTLIYANSV